MYAELRADILAGRRAPGTRLPFTELCSRYEASMGVVREALMRLTEQGLVESQPQHGFRVTPLSADDLAHLTDARCLIEAAALRQSVENGSVEWESLVLAAHHRLERTPQPDPTDPDRLAEDWVTAHADYHHAMLSACPNPRLLAVAEGLRASAELYRRWSVPLGHEQRDIAGEHRKMLDALLDHNADDAVRLLTEHIRHTTNVLIEQTGSPGGEDDVATA